MNTRVCVINIPLNKIVPYYLKNVIQHTNISYILSIVKRSSAAWWLYKIHETNSCYNVLLVRYFVITSIYIYIYTYHSPLAGGFFEVATESWPEWDIWTHDHWIQFRRSNRLNYQAMSSTHTQLNSTRTIYIYIYIYLL